MQAKKMTLMQLTFIVAVNMMGSGIIMLPTNMAKVGAISLLSWVVTALGSMAMACGFAQAGVFNQREGGLSAYAEDAYGKAGYFGVSFLYFLSLAIANVAVAVSAVGYFTGFFPWLSSTPVATTVGVIALLWLTTVANFGGRAHHRAHRFSDGMGRDPAGRVDLHHWLALVQRRHLRGGLEPARREHPAGDRLEHHAHLVGLPRLGVRGAELGRGGEPETQRAARVPARHVGGRRDLHPFDHGHCGDRAQRRLANSTGPFALAYAQMFNPTVGNIVMALAVMACVGSLLGWQFTLAQTGKAAADQRMFPALFSKVNAVGAPVAGMVVMGVVQSLMALSTMSPDLSAQFGTLVNLAVVTNVIPYIFALSALAVIMQAANVPEAAYRRNLAVVAVGMVYNVYALWSAGLQAVMGGMLVMGFAWVIWASSRRVSPHRRQPPPRPRGPRQLDRTGIDW